MIEIANISGVGEYEQKKWKDGEQEAELYIVPKNGKAFCVNRGKTIEVRCDRGLSVSLMEKYESVMESRYFGRGGIEIVDCGQLSDEEIEDLVRLSYNLTMEEEK